WLVVVELDALEPLGPCCAPNRPKAGHTRGPHMAGKGRTRKKSGGRRASPRRRVILAVLSLLFAVLGVSGVSYYREPLADAIESGTARLSPAAPQDEAPTRRPETFTIARVKRVVDGDTL